jgi:hypothetical protein
MIVTLRLEQIWQLFSTVCLIALRRPCCAQAQGGHRGRPFDACVSPLVLLGADPKVVLRRDGVVTAFADFSQGEVGT